MSDQDQIYIPARTLHKVHLFTGPSGDDEDENNLKSIHIFENVVVATDGQSIAAYNLLDILSSTGNGDVYDLLVGHALPKGIWMDMIKYPWLIYVDQKTGHKTIEIQRKDNAMEYIVSDKANEEVLAAYGKISNYVEYSDPGTLFTDAEFLKNLASVFGKEIAIKHRKFAKSDGNLFCTQVVKKHCPWLVVFRLWHAEDLGDYPFGLQF
jgi:hypothetical protein